MNIRRNENISAFQNRGYEPWNPPITAFTDTGGSLRSVPRQNSSSLGKLSASTVKGSSQYLFKTSSANLYTNFQPEDYDSTNACSNTFATNSMNSINRELSPVRWCDRKVDGVYLGKSGWVQVQQRSLDDTKGIVYNENITFPNHSSRSYFSDLDSSRVCSEKKREWNRQLNLPLPLKKRTFRGSNERPSKFVQGLESVSPPSVTPIISPPPAFKDDGLNAELSRQLMREPFYSEGSFMMSSENGVNAGASSYSSKEGWSPSETLFLTLSAGSTSPMREVLSYRTPKAKSQEEDLSNRIWCGGQPNSAATLSSFGFRSLDNDSGVVRCSSIKVDESDFIFRNLKPSKEKENCNGRGVEKCVAENEGDEDKNSKGRVLRLQNSFKEGLDGLEKNSFKAFRQRTFQRDERKTCNIYKSRSSSLDSSSSTGSSTSSNFGGKSSLKIISSRRTGSKEKQNFELENSSRDVKNFYVKRSRSLQLSEKRSPNESTMKNHCAAGKSWDPMPPECSSFRATDEENFSKLPQHLHRVLVTVNGDSIPVNTSGNQFLESLNKITTSEKEQKKLIMEAEKEARIISEFLNGTRSQAAARNLLMHRYFSEHAGLMESKKGIPAKSEYDFHFLCNDSWRQNKQTVCDINRGRNYCKENKVTSSNPPKRSSARVYSKLFNFNTPSQIKSSYSQSFGSQRKKDLVEKKNSGGSSQTPSGQYGCRNKTKFQRVSRETCSNSTENPRSSLPNNIENILRHNIEQLETELGAMGRNGSFKNTSRTSPLHKMSGRHEQSPQESSPMSSSSSIDACEGELSIQSKKNPKSTNPSGLLDKNSKMPLENLNFRPGSVSESDDSIPPEADQRSLSLPRSFLSERYKSISDQRGFKELRRNQPDDLESVNGSTSELTENLRCSRTAPTTPTRDLKYGKSSDSLNEIQCNKPTCATFLDKSPFLRPRRLSRKIVQKEPECFEWGLNEENRSLVFKEPWKIPENSSRAVLKNVKKNLKDFNESINQEADNGETGNSHKSMQNFAHTTHFENELFGKSGRLSKSEKCDGQEKCDIQMRNRLNIDSSESQGTYLQGFNSPLLGQTQWSDYVKKGKYGKAVRRTNSDLGRGQLSNIYVKRHSIWPGIRCRNGSTIWDYHSKEDRTKHSGFMKTQLRRSLSQPSGLNELLPFSLRSSRLKCFALSEDENNSRGKNSEEDFLSGSESSLASLRETKKTIDITSRDETAILAEAVWDHVAIDSCELPFRAGDVIEVLDTQNWDWWWGATAENRGYFPSAFVRLRVSQDETVEDCLAATTKGRDTLNRLRRGKSVSLLSNDQVRSRVVKELLSTERDFVKNLRDVKEGYIEQCKRRANMFNPEQITTIFGNLENILSFQENFLKDLEGKMDKEYPYKSCIGQVFLTHGSDFRMYSEYCNSYPMAIATLQDLYQKDNYSKFFETCRLKKNLIEIPLDGYLLTPVQRICKYPLQLAELLKYTKSDHPDFKAVGEALETMKKVTTLINERKRKMESLEKLAAWQQRVEGWMGEDLIERSSQLIHQGDVVRITSGMWTTNITLFLFDHQIVYCKRDLLKKSVFIYKGRIFLDASFIVDIPDGKNQQLGINIKYGLKICSNLRDKWLLFCCRSSEDKAKWLDAFAEEKKFVAYDKEVDLSLPPTAKHLAKMAAKTKKKCPPCKPKYKNKILPNHEEVSFRNCQSGTTKSKPKRVGTWFTFGGVIKSSKASATPGGSLQRIT